MSVILHADDNAKLNGYTSLYASSYLQARALYESQRKNWYVEKHSDQGFFNVKDKDGTHLVYSNSIYKGCSCSFFVDNEVNTCPHIEAIKRSNLFNNGQSKITYLHRGKLFEKNGSIEKEIFDLNQIDITSVVLPGVKEFIGKVNSKISFSQNVYTYDDLNIFKSFGINIRDYQFESIQRMLNMGRSILTLKMGLGKTICALICSSILNKTSNIIICPTSLKNQWAKEIARFNLGTVLLVSSKKDLPKYTNQNFVIVNYEILNRNKSFLQTNSFEVGILDEIQKIKNDESKTWASINELKSNYLFTLSGTPIQNNVTDLVSVMKILNKDEFSPEWKFYEKFCLLGKTKVLGWNTAKKKELRDQVGKYIINPTILPGTFPMPSKKEIVVNVKLTQVQEGIHDRATESAKMLLSKSYNKPLTFGEKAMLNSLLLKARRAITDERLVGGTNKGERLQEVENTIVNYHKQNKKVVVYSEWIDVLNLVGNELLTLGINYVQFDGRLTSKKRGVVLDKFINDPTVTVFLSTDSGGLGIDGLQLASSAMIHVEDLWNPMKMEQRNGRLIRMLQKDASVDIIRFYSDSEIEIMLAESNNRKYNIIKEIL